MGNEVNKYVSSVPLLQKPRKRIGLKVREQAITTPKIANDAITTDKIADRTIIGEKIQNGAITGDKIKNYSITADQIAPNAITTEKLADGVIGDISGAISEITGAAEVVRTLNLTEIGTKEEARDNAERERAINEQARQTAEETREANETTRNGNELARVQAETGRNIEWGSLKTEVSTAIGNAESATANAEKVNVTLSGMTVTVTDRNGNSKLVDIGFKIHKTYSSVTAMNADAANVPEGNFVLIASSVEDEDNAKLYCRNSEGFSYLTDLSGAKGIQGDSFTYEDFTEEQIAELKRPATEAAGDATTQAGYAKEQGDAAKAIVQEYTNYKTQLDTALDNIDGAIQDASAATGNANSAKDNADNAAASATSAAETATGEANKATLAASAANTAAGNAASATEAANSAAEKANAVANHPTYIDSNCDVYNYDVEVGEYVKGTNVKGDPGRDLLWTTMSQEDKQQVIDDVKSQVDIYSVINAISFDESTGDIYIDYEANNSN